MSLETQIILRGDIYLFTINSPQGILLGVITFAIKDTLKCQLLTVSLCKYTVFLINSVFYLMIKRPSHTHSDVSKFIKLLLAVLFQK